MLERKLARRFVAAPIAAIVLSIAFGAGCSTTPEAVSSANDSKAAGQSPVADIVFLSGRVVTMNDKMPVADAIAVADGLIVGVGSHDEIMALAGPETQTVRLEPGTTLLPGFIDAHSHMAGYAFYDDPDHWLDVSSINMYFKPPPGDPRCSAPNDPQVCFVPVQTQDDVVTRLTAAAGAARMRAAGTGTEPFVLAFNYDSSRLGHSRNCAMLDGLAFACPNFENGHAREQLDAIATDLPIYVTSESGHIAYVNTPALALLNICGTEGSKPTGCYQPNTNTDVEIVLANMGQLDEDLTFYATTFFQGQFVMKGNPGLGPELLRNAAHTYAQHGYTLVQEGAASLGLAAMYLELLGRDGSNTDFPVAAAMIAYDATSSDFRKTVDIGVAARDLFGRNNPLLSVAALKSFADGSPQGYTGYFDAPYFQLFAPFTDQLIFKQPYSGLPDLDRSELLQRLEMAHAAGFPMILHQNGDAAIRDAVSALLNASRPPAGKRDVVLHAPAIGAGELGALAQRGDVALSFLTQNTYFYGLPECQQVLGPQRAVNMYPAKTAIDHGLHVTLHSDSPVTPPYPLFEVWVAKTRKAQQPSWYPNRDKTACPEVMVDAGAGLGDQRISIRDGIKAFTVDAAWQYGMENVRGSLEVGKYADIVMLSADPLTMETDPDRLKTVRTLGTVRRGVIFYNPDAGQPPIWPE